MGEVPEAVQWLAWARERLEQIVLIFSPDGAFHEGPADWDFSMPTLYMFIDLYESMSGISVPAGEDGLQGQGLFRFHYLYPGLSVTAAMEDTTIGRGKTTCPSAAMGGQAFPGSPHHGSRGRHQRRSDNQSL